jgi:hypothetical protein
MLADDWEKKEGVRIVSPSLLVSGDRIKVLEKETWVFGTVTSTEEYLDELKKRNLPILYTPDGKEIHLLLDKPYFNSLTPKGTYLVRVDPKKAEVIFVSSNKQECKHEFIPLFDSMSCRHCGVRNDSTF